MGYIKNQSLPDMVEKAMEVNKMTRDDDYFLLGVVADMFFPPLERPIRTYSELSSMLYQLPELNEIRRARRIVWKRHNMKKYLPTSVFVAEKRRIPPKVFEAYQKANPDPVERDFNKLTSKEQLMQEGHYD